MSLTWFDQPWGLLSATFSTRLIQSLAMSGAALRGRLGCRFPVSPAHAVHVFSTLLFQATSQYLLWILWWWCAVSSHPRTHGVLWRAPKLQRPILKGRHSIHPTPRPGARTGLQSICHGGTEKSSLRMLRGYVCCLPLSGCRAITLI